MRVPFLVLALSAALAGCGTKSDPPAAGAGTGAVATSPVPQQPAPPAAAAPAQSGAPESTTVSLLRAEDPEQAPILEIHTWAKGVGLPMPGMGFDIHWQTDDGPSKTATLTGDEGWTRKGFPPFAMIHNMYLRPSPLTAPASIILGNVLEKGTILRVDVVVQAAGVIRGVVLDELGQPFPGAVLAAFHSPQAEIDQQERPAASSTGRTDEKGEFDLGGFPPGPFVLEAISEERCTTWRLTGVLTEGQVVEGIEIQVEPFHTVFGQVLDAAGNPVKKAQIVAGKAGRRQQSRPGPTEALRYVPGRPHLTTSDDRGSFSLSAVPDSQVWSVLVTHPRFRRQIVRLEPGQVDLLVRIEEGLRISGTILQPDGAPAVRVPVTLVGLEEPVGELSTKQGLFSLGGLESGTGLWLVVLGEGFAPLLHGPLDLSAAAIDDLELHLQAPQVLAGKVIASDEKPVEGARVSLQRLELPAGLPAAGIPAVALGQGSSLTGAGGEFSFEGLAPGRYLVTALAPDGRTQRLEFAAGTLSAQIRLP
jgi:protocatechuate 3,4-dioxygenase beta subunit